MIREHAAGPSRRRGQRRVRHELSRPEVGASLGQVVERSIASIHLVNDSARIERA
jgi:hypothetical protein